jgi:RNA polymerase sigma factor (sigma-70 family)
MRRVRRDRRPQSPTEAPSYNDVWSLSDETLLAGLAAQDQESTAAFIRRFQRRVFGLAFTILGDRGAAEEVAQETFVRAWRHATAYDPRRGAVSTWILTIARNIAIDVLRMRRYDLVDPHVVTDLYEDADDPSARIEDAHRVRLALMELPEEQRRAIVLSSFYGRTAREISELDGIPVGTVKTRLRAALGKLRSKLEVPDE